MSAYDNVVVGKLKLKGKPLDVKSSAVMKKKKKTTTEKNHSSFFTSSADSAGDNTARSNHNGISEALAQDDNLTPAQRRYLEQKEKLELRRLAKMARKSHRDRIHEFNQYLANLTEHYNIPKVGPG